LETEQQKFFLSGTVPYRVWATVENERVTLFVDAEFSEDAGNTWRKSDTSVDSWNLEGITFFDSFEELQVPKPRNFEP